MATEEAVNPPHRRTTLLRLLAGAACGTALLGGFGARGRLSSWLEDSDSSSARRELQANSIVCQDTLRWGQIQWVYLSAEEQDAWLRLGWTPTTWNAAHPVPSLATSTVLTTTTASGTTLLTTSTAATTTTSTTTFIPPSERRCYQNLTEDQQDAVRTLGYSISTWTACKNPACPWPAGIPKPSDPCIPQMLWVNGLYAPSKKWLDFTNSKRAALIQLGWDPAGTRWQTQDTPLAYSRDWNQLGGLLQEAASFLQYNADAWNGCERVAPCIPRLQMVQESVSALNWYSVPAPIMGRLFQLGWTEKLWLDGFPPPSYETSWLNISAEQRVAARLLGYTQSTWELCPGADCHERFRWLQQKYAGVAWSRLKPSQQRAWTLLQSSPALWAAGGFLMTPTMALRWAELPADMQRMARYLGFDELSWQGCGSWTPPRADNTSNATAPLNPLRTVRARMTIQRPFSEVSGNVYGNQVGALTTSFQQVFQEAVGRALFCGNPPLSTTSSTYLNLDGSPLCLQNTSYQMQMMRILPLSIVEGSIVVDFLIVANATTNEMTAPDLLLALQRQLANPNTPLTQDKYFSKYALAATVQEVPPSADSPVLAAALSLEQTRGAYRDGNACQLSSDARTGGCITAGAYRQEQGGILLALLLLLAFPFR